MPELLEHVTDPQTVQPPAADAQIPAAQADSTGDVNSGSGGSPAEPVKPVLDEGLASLARDYGFDPEAWKDNPDALERAVTQLDRLYSHHARLAQQKPSAAAQQQTTTAAAKAEAKRFELALKALEDGEIDPGIVKFSREATDALQKMNAHYQSQIDAYEQKFGELSPMVAKMQALEQYVQYQESLRFEQQLDDAFDKLGDEYKDLYGKGGMSTLRPSSLQAHNRNDVANALAEIQAMDAQAGRRSTFASQFRRAQHMTHGDQLPTIERRRLALQAHQQKNVALNRPASKNGQPLNDEDKTLARLKEWTARVESS